MDTGKWAGTYQFVRMHVMLMRFHAYDRIQAADLLRYGRRKAVTSLRSGDPQPYDIGYVIAAYLSYLGKRCAG
jgi:hypothetical protein